MAEQEQNRELLRKPVQNVAEKVKLYFLSSLCSAWFRTFRPVRNVTDPAKLSKIDVLHATELVILPAERRSKCLFLPESITDRVNGGPRGDLLVEVNVSSHPIFQRQDMNIFSTAPISFAQAVLGGKTRISTVDGDVIYEVKPGTQTDTRIRLKGKGVPSLRNKNIRGDQYVTLVVQVPTSLSAEAKEALRAFDAVSGDSLHTGAGEGIKQEKHHKKRGFFKKED